MWGVDKRDAAVAGGSASTGSAGAVPVTEGAASAIEKARRHLAEQHAAAAAAAASTAIGASLAAGSPNAPPTGSGSSAAHLSTAGYRQPVSTTSSSSSSATATPLYSPNDWSRHLPTLTHDLSFSSPPTLSSLPSPSRRAMAELYFAGAAGSGVDAESAVGQWQSAPSSTHSPFPSFPLIASSSLPPSAASSSVAARSSVGVIEQHQHQSAYSSPHSSPPVLSPSSASAGRDVDDIWAVEVAKINRQTPAQHYSLQQQRQQRSPTAAAFTGREFPASTPSAALSAVPLGPPVPRPSSAQSKLLSVLSQSRSEDEAIKWQQLYHQQMRQQQQQQQQQQQLIQTQSQSLQQRQRPPLHEEQYQQHPAQHSQQQHQPVPIHTSHSVQLQHQQQSRPQRRSSDRLTGSASPASEPQQPTPVIRFAPHRRTSPSPLPLLFTAPPPAQSRASSTPQTGSSLSAVAATAPSTDSSSPSFSKKLLIVRSPSPRSASANQPFQPRESFSGLGSTQAFQYPTQASEQQSQHPTHYYSTADTIAIYQQQQQQQQQTAATQAASSAVDLRAEAARAALAYLTSETDQQSNAEQRAAISAFLSTAEQQTAAAAADSSFVWPQSQHQQQQQQQRAQQTGYPAAGMSQVQSVTVHHILADRTTHQQQQSLPFSSTQLGAEPVSVGQADLSHFVGGRSLPSHIPPHLPLQHAGPPHIPYNALTGQSEFAARPSSAASSSSVISPLVAFQILSAAGVLSSPSQVAAYQGLLSAADAVPGVANAAAGSLYADMHLQQQQIQHMQQQRQAAAAGQQQVELDHQLQSQHSASAPSAETPFSSHFQSQSQSHSQSRLPWSSGYPLPQSALSSDALSSAHRHRSFSAGMPNEAEARVKAEEDDAEMERLLALRVQQQQQQQQQHFQHQHQRQQQEQQYFEQQQQQQQHDRYYAPAPSPALGLPSDLSLSAPPIFSSNEADIPHFAASVTPADSDGGLRGAQQQQQQHRQQRTAEYSDLSRASAQHSYNADEMTASIPTFSSSMQSDPPQPSHSPGIHSQQSQQQLGQFASLSSSSLSSSSASLSSSKRRVGAAVSSSELWACPFNCNKVYRVTSSRSITRHMQNCPNKPLYESFLAAGRAAGLEDSYRLGGKRKQKKRRKNSELLEHERWNCPNGCGTFFRSTSTKSIHRHKRMCRFGQSSAAKGSSDGDPPDDEDDGGEEGDDDDQRDEDEDEGEQGDDDADEDEDEKRGDTRTQYTAQSMQTAQHVLTSDSSSSSSSEVDDVAGELSALTLSAARSRVQYNTPTTVRKSQHTDQDSLPSSAEKAHDEQDGEYKQLQPPVAPTRSSSTPPLLTAAALTVNHPDSGRGLLPCRRHSFDTSFAQPVSFKQQQRHKGDADSPGGRTLHRKDSQSGTDSGGSNSKNSQASSSSTGLSSASSESSAASSATSSASSSAASSSPASQPHTPTRTSPAATQRSLATTAQRSDTQQDRRQRRRANSQDRNTQLTTTAATVATDAASQVSVAFLTSASASAGLSLHGSPLLSSSLPSVPLSSISHTVHELRLSTSDTAALVGSKSRSARQLQLDVASPADSAVSEARRPG